MERPNKKVTAAGAGAAAGVILAWLLGQFGVEVSGEVGAAFSTFGGFVGGYFKRE